MSEAADRLLAALDQRPVVMGILNVTPDSFSDGGQFASAENASLHAKKMRADGADIIDIGAESTRPGAEEVSAEDEWSRLAPLFKALQDQAFDVPLSVDTYKASTAAKALDHGASLVNDVWGLQHDGEMAPLLAARGAPVVVMHNRREVDESIDIMRDIEEFFGVSLARAAQAGIDPGKIILDPGIGFGKSYAQNFTVLHNLAQLRAFGRPLMVGLSRKRFIGRLLEREVDDRLFGTLGANLFAREQGASLFRVHDVKAHADALKMREALQQGQG